MRLDRVMAEVWDDPLITVRLDGADTEKSVTLTATVVECDTDPLVARIDTA